jgi:putative GTP pyrophosphokinase
MASLDFEQEKSAFRRFYEGNRKHLNDARNAYIRIIASLIRRSDVGEVTKIEGRVKEKEECIKKFHRKYQGKLEADEQRRKRSASRNFTVNTRASSKPMNNHTRSRITSPT